MKARGTASKSPPTSMSLQSRSFSPDGLSAEQYLLISWIKANSTKSFLMHFHRSLSAIPKGWLCLSASPGSSLAAEAVLTVFACQLCSTSLSSMRFPSGARGKGSLPCAPKASTERGVQGSVACKGWGRLPLCFSATAF